MSNATDAVRENMRTRRKRRGMTCAQMGAALSEHGAPWDRFTVAAFERGTRQNITVRELCAAAGVLGCSAEDLLTAPGDCRRCHAQPPFGFTCNTCGRIGEL